MQCAATQSPVPSQTVPLSSVHFRPSAAGASLQEPASHETALQVVLTPHFSVTFSVVHSVMPPPPAPPPPALVEVVVGAIPPLPGT